MKESFSDFSIVKEYLELKGKYDTEVTSFREKTRALEEKYKKHAADLEQEVRKRDEYIKALDKKLQELNRLMAEKDEQLKTMGLQLHKMKMESGQKSTAPPEGERSKFGLFK